MSVFSFTALEKDPLVFVIGKDGDYVGRLDARDHRSPVVHLERVTLTFVELQMIVDKVKEIWPKEVAGVGDAALLAYFG